MSDVNRVGTVRDWPAKVIAAGVVLLALGLLLRGVIGFMLGALAVPLLLGGGLSLMIRRGAFTPRR